MSLDLSHMKRTRRRRWAVPRIEALEDRTTPAHNSLGTALPIPPTGGLVEVLGSAGEVQFYSFRLTEAGRFTARTHADQPAALDTRTCLLNSYGGLLVLSDGQSPGDRDDLITQHLLPGLYYLRVEGRPGQTGAYQLQTEFAAATPPGQPLPVNFDRAYPFGLNPPYQVAGDFNGDGHADLATANTYAFDVSVLYGLGDGSFRPAVNLPVGAYPFGIAAADFNRDGRLDLATANQFSNDVSVLLAQADGTFAPEVRTAGGQFAWGMSAGDVNGDGNPDLVTSNLRDNTASVLLGRGDGTFQPEYRLAVGEGPNGASVGDLNNDGRLDIVTANFNSTDVSLLLGNGDGTFQPEARLPVGEAPSNATVADLDGDGARDIVVAVTGADEIAVFWGPLSGNRFTEVSRLRAGLAPYNVAAVDLDGDGRLDLAVGNYRSRDVVVLLGRGDGTFAAGPRLAVGRAVGSLTVRDLDGDGVLDLATANGPSDDVSVLRGLGGAAFAAAVHFAAGADPQALTAADFTGDGVIDLATANARSDDVTLLAGRGDGTFAAPRRVEAGDYPAAVLAADFNRDGRADLALATHLAAEAAILPGMGDGTFLPPGTLSAAGHAAPVVVDWDGDGGEDVVVVERGGRVLLRLARPGSPGAFEPPVVLNPDGPAARDLALVRTAAGVRLAALDALGAGLTLYAPAGGGGVAVSDGPDVPGSLPVRVVAGDLSGDGLDDLVVVASGTSEAFVYLGTPGGFAAAADHRLRAGARPTDAALADLDGDGRLDIVITNRLSGDVSLFLNKPARPFASAGRFRTGTGLSFVEAQGRTTAARSADAPVRVLAGNADGDVLAEVLVLDSGANNISVLDATEAGGLLNPSANRTFAAGLRPGTFVAGQFNADAHLDLAVLNGDGRLTVLLGDAAGRFTAAGRLSAGNAPSGLAARDLTGDGAIDLLVSNDFGDLLILPGNGDGTFRPFLRAGQNITLAVADLDGDGRRDFVFANEGLDRVSVEYGQARMDVVQDRDDGALAPGAVRLADMDADGRLDLVVANGGANSVFVYLQAGGQFAARQEFAVGTNPAGLDVADLTGDGLPELVVANEGSNDVSVLVGRVENGGWTMTPGPRLGAGAGPVDVLVREVNGDGRPDLLVASSQSNDVQVLAGVGGEFFDDRSPVNLATGGSSPRQLFVGQFDALPGLDLVTLNFGSNDLTLFSNFGPGRSIATGGDGPASAVAGDFNADGLDDLFVVHNGDGRLALLLGERDGLALSRAFALPGLLHPTDVAFAGGGDEVTFFVTDEGREAATPFVLTFLRPPGGGTPGGTPPAEPSQPQFALFVPGFPEGLAIPSVGGGEGVAVSAAAGPAGGETLLNRLLPAGLLALLGLDGDSEVSVAPEADAPPPEVSAEEAAWLRFLMGLPELAPAERAEAVEDIFAAWPAAGGAELDEIARQLARGDEAPQAAPLAWPAGAVEQAERPGRADGVGDAGEEAGPVGLFDRSLAVAALGVAHGARLRPRRGERRHDRLALRRPGR